MVEMEVSTPLIQYLKVIQLVMVGCWCPQTTTPTEMLIFQGIQACINVNPLL